MPGPTGKGGSIRDSISRDAANQDAKRDISTKQDSLGPDSGVLTEPIGSSGKFAIRIIDDRNYLSMKVGDVWYYILALDEPLSLEDQINTTVTNIELSASEIATLTITTALILTGATITGLNHSSISNVTSDQHHAEAHTVASHSDTGATGEKLDTLTDGSDAVLLHTHSNYILHSLATAINDFIVASGSGAYVKKTLAETGAILEGDIQHDNLQGVTSDEHVAHSGVDVTAGNGLTGGGNISTTRTIDVGGGDGIAVNANDIEVDLGASTPGLKFTGGKLFVEPADFAGSGLRDNGSDVLGVDISAMALFGGTFDPNADKLAFHDITGNTTYGILWSKIATAIAGAGLVDTSGGLDIGAGTLITVAANDVGVTPDNADYGFIGSTTTPWAATWLRISQFAGLGLSHSAGVLAFAITEFPITNIAAGDFLIFQDIDDSNGTKRITLTLFVTTINGAGLSATAGVLAVIYDLDDPTTIQPNDAAVVGVANEASRGDHQHAIATAAPVSVDLGANAEGNATSFSRSNHQHQLDVTITPTWLGAHVWRQDCTFQANLDILGVLNVNVPWQEAYSVNIKPETKGRALSIGEADYYENYSILTESLAQSDVSTYDNTYYV